MTQTPQLALLQSMTLPDDKVAEWVHLLPSGTIATVDGRGPYSVANAAEVIAASFLDRKKLPIDENHAIDLAAPRGEASPARGYVVELQARTDGIWGRVDWTPTGKALMEDRAYVGISPAILHDAKGQVLRILSASLVNRPKPDRRPGLASAAGSPSTTNNAHTLPMAVNRPPWSTSTPSEPISRCKL